jgi:hypothetical protein
MSNYWPPAANQRGICQDFATGKFTMQGGSATNSGYHAANTDVGQTEDQMVEATIGALANMANMATATATDRGVVTTLTEANSRLAKQLQDCSNELKDIKALLKKGKSR